METLFLMNDLHEETAPLVSLIKALEKVAQEFPFVCLRLSLLQDLLFESLEFPKLLLDLHEQHFSLKALFGLLHLSHF